MNEVAEWKDFFSIEVEDVTGKLTPLRSVVKGRATVFMLLRHFGWYDNIFKLKFLIAT